MDIQTKDGILLRGIPDGTPDEAIKARITKIREERGGSSPQAEVAPEAPAPKKENSGDLVSSSILRGVAALGGLPGDAIRLLESGITSVGNVFGLEPKRSFKGVTAGKEDIVKAIEKATGTPLYAPESTPERYAGKAIEGAVSLPGKATQMAMGGLSGLFGEMGHDVGGTTGAVVGSLLPFVAPKVAAPVIGFGTDIAKGRVSDVRAGKVLRAVAGDKRAAIEAEMAKQGGDLTAAQAAADAGSTRWSALGKRAEDARSEFFNDLKGKQEAARRAMLGQVTPDIKVAEAVRDSAASPFYKQAEKAVVKFDAPMMKVFERMPKGTLDAAENIARMDGKTFQFGKFVPAHSVKTGLFDASGNEILKQVPAQYPSMTGESLHYVKRALSDIANAKDAAKGIGRDTQDAARGVLRDFLKEFEHRVPDYGTARSTFASASEPVNQSQVIQAMQEVLAKPGGGERVQPFLNVLGKGEQALLKRSTGFPRYESGDLNKVLSPTQYDAVKKVESELLRDTNVANMASAGREDVAAVLAKEASRLKLPMWLNRYATAANKGLDITETILNQKTMEKVYKAMESGKSAAEAMNTLSTVQRNKVLKAMAEAKFPKEVRALQEASQRSDEQ